MKKFINENNEFSELIKQKKGKTFFNPHLILNQDLIENFIASHSEWSEDFFFPSSGSSGVIKWIHHSRETLEASARSLSQYLELSEEDRQMIALPTFHVGGFSQWVRATLSRTKTFQWTDQWSAQKCVELMRELQITVTSLVPTQIYDFVVRKIKAPPTLRAVLVGGSALNPDLYLEARELSWPLLPSYGMTEAASTVAAAALDSLHEKTYPELFLLDHWKNSSTGRNCQRLKLKGPALMKGCLFLNSQNGQLSYQGQEKDSFFKCQDRVKLLKTDSGQVSFHFLGRQGETVKIKGEWVDLKELKVKIGELMNSQLNELDPYSWELRAKEDLRNTYRLLIYMEKKSAAGVDLETLLQKINLKLNSLELIQDIIILEKLPRSPLGKFLPSELED